MLKSINSSHHEISIIGNIFNLYLWNYQLEYLNEC